MKLTYEEDRAQGLGHGMIRCTGENFPEGRLQMALQQSRDQKFLGRSGWYTQVEFLDVDQRREGNDVILLLGPAIMGRLTEGAHRISLRGADGVVFKAQVVLRGRSVGVRGVKEGDAPPEDPNAKRRRLCQTAVQETEEAVRIARAEAERARRIAADHPDSAELAQKAREAEQVMRDAEQSMQSARRAANILDLHTAQDEATRARQAATRAASLAQAAEDAVAAVDQAANQDRAEADQAAQEAEQAAREARAAADQARRLADEHPLITGLPQQAQEADQAAQEAEQAAQSARQAANRGDRLQSRTLARTARQAANRAESLASAVSASATRSAGQMQAEAVKLAEAAGLAARQAREAAAQARRTADEHPLITGLAPIAQEAERDAQAAERAAQAAQQAAARPDLDATRAASRDAADAASRASDKAARVARVAAAKAGEAAGAGAAAGLGGPMIGGALAGQGQEEQPMFPDGVSGVSGQGQEAPMFPDGVSGVSGQGQEAPMFPDGVSGVAGQGQEAPMFPDGVSGVSGQGQDSPLLADPIMGAVPGQGTPSGVDATEPIKASASDQAQTGPGAADTGKGKDQQGKGLRNAGIALAVLLLLGLLTFLAMKGCDGGGSGGSGGSGSSGSSGSGGSGSSGSSGSGGSGSGSGGSGSAGGGPTQPTYPPTHTNTVGMNFVLIPAGTFMMGCDPASADKCQPDEQPRHEVRISRPFYLAIHEVTQAQWQQLMGNNPSRHKGDDHPVENVTWQEAQAFIDALNKKEGHQRYRLPTEAEWEYAARAKTTTAYSFGDNAQDLGRYGVYDEPLSGSHHPVGEKKANPWGLFDMHGNVTEWVQDRYGQDYYGQSPSTDPTGPSTGEEYAARGCGWWSDGASECRSARRFQSGGSANGKKNEITGFRVALMPE